MNSRPIGICKCRACLEHGRTLPTEWFIARTRERAKRLEGRRAA